MNITRHLSKAITALFSVIIAVILGSSPARAILPDTTTHSADLLEQRLAKVRQKLQQQQEYKPDENSELSSSQHTPQVDTNETLLSQWYNWGNWRNGWGNWGNY